MTAAPSANTPAGRGARAVRVGQGLQEGLGGTQRRLAGLLDGFVQQEQHFGADLAAVRMASMNGSQGSTSR